MPRQRRHRFDIQRQLARLGEIHLRTPTGLSYNYCGPGTRLRQRLNSSNPGISNPINILDALCQKHDIAYSKSKDLDDKHVADDNLLEAISNIPKNMQHKKTPLRRVWGTPRSPIAPILFNPVTLGNQLTATHPTVVHTTIVDLATAQRHTQKTATNLGAPATGGECPGTHHHQKENSPTTRQFARGPHRGCRRYPCSKSKQQQQYLTSITWDEIFVGEPATHPTVVHTTIVDLATAQRHSHKASTNASGTSIWRTSLAFPAATCQCHGTHHH
ncbi:predicted protein [Nematostella vectensis]|uniref:Phospholipase A2-like domain-containing protein n=1 Tax=Nematostella vectensis TaxID=45351 RepID=A7RUZ8_NEMVE|nr:predicted protein [Nematostella vectensis]|eukprot:XP_001636763.1 predicted protein [Nematostella vectensis]